MQQHRPRLKESEYNHLQLKQFYDKKLFKVLIFSDPHGWLADLKALRCINKILQHNKFDEVVINGDVTDLPYLSKHTAKLYEDGILAEYSEVKEIEYTKEQILKPLRASTKAKIRVRTGNHCERITNPFSLGEKQLAKLCLLHKHYETTNYDKMLGLNESEGYIYDPSDVYCYFDKFYVTHGLSLAKDASTKNIYEYMGSGTTGHSHRINSKYLTNRKAPYVWYESGCTRLIEQVEYFPTGKVADWQQGFVTVMFSIEGDEVRFYGNSYIIIDGRAHFNGVVYDGN